MEPTGQRFRSTDRPSRGVRVAPPRFETYESGPETVIFDGENPLAWIASANAVPVAQRA